MMPEVCSGRMDDEETDYCFGMVVVYTWNKFGRLGFKKLR